jgi:hypothetical protein
MRRSLLLLTTMALGVLMVSSVAQAASPRAKCQQEAASLGSLDGYTFVYGNNKNNVFTDTAGQPEVFCGLGGNDSIDTLEAGDIFIGGADNDTVYQNTGTFNGGDGIDSVYDNYGTFNGGDGTDSVVNNYTNFGSTVVSVEKCDHGCV